MPRSHIQDLCTVQNPDHRSLLLFCSSCFLIFAFGNHTLAILNIFDQSYQEALQLGAQRTFLVRDTIFSSPSCPLSHSGFVRGMAYSGPLPLSFSLGLDRVWGIYVLHFGYKLIISLNKLFCLTSVCSSSPLNVWISFSFKLWSWALCSKRTLTTIDFMLRQCIQTEHIWHPIHAGFSGLVFFLQMDTWKGFV